MKGGPAVVVLGFLLAACADPITAPGSSATNTLDVRCDGKTTEVLTPTVQARSDGVHVLIHNTNADQELSVSWLGGGDGAPPGDTTLVFPIEPGNVPDPVPSDL